MTMLPLGLMLPLHALPYCQPNQAACCLCFFSTHCYKSPSDFSDLHARCCVEPPCLGSSSHNAATAVLRSTDFPYRIKAMTLSYKNSAGGIADTTVLQQHMLSRPIERDMSY